MSVLIKGMEMPERCIWCVFFRRNGLHDYCCISSAQPKDGLIPADCPLIELPDHGDLIDRDELMKHGVYMPMDGGNLPIVYMSYVKGAKAVISAERSEE